MHVVWKPGFLSKNMNLMLQWIGNISSVARSLVLAGHLLYPSRSHKVLRSRSRDMSGTNIVLWLGMCLARPGLGYNYSFRTLYEVRDGTAHIHMLLALQ